MKKLTKEELKRKAESIKNLFDDIISGRIDVPDKALIIDFDIKKRVSGHKNNYIEIIKDPKKSYVIIRDGIKDVGMLAWDFNKKFWIFEDWQESSQMKEERKDE